MTVIGTVNGTVITTETCTVIGCETTPGGGGDPDFDDVQYLYHMGGTPGSTADLVDTRGKSNDMVTFSGAQISAINGKFGQSWFTNGTTDYGQIPATTGKVNIDAPLTIEGTLFIATGDLAGTGGAY